MTKYDKEQIKEQLDVRQLLQDNFGVVVKKNRSSCPLHGGSNKTALKSSRTGYNCYGCGARGDVFDLLGEIYGTNNFAEQLKYGAELAGIAPIENETFEQRSQRERNRRIRARKREEKQAQRQRKIEQARQTRPGIMSQIWDIIKDAPLTAAATAWFISRGIDPVVAHKIGARDWSARKDELSCLFNEIKDQLATAGLRNDEGKLWWPVCEWSVPGVAIPCWHVGEDAPHEWRWRVFEPTNTKTYQQAKGTSNQASKGQILGKHQAQDCTHLVVVEGEPDYLSATQLLSHIEGVGVVGLCSVANVDWLLVLEGLDNLEQITIATHHDRRIPLPLPPLDKQSIFIDLAKMLGQRDLDITVIDVEGKPDINDMHKARQYEWFVQSIEGFIPQGRDLTGQWLSLLQQQRQQAKQEALKGLPKSQWLKCARPTTKTFETLDQLRTALADHARQAVRHDGVTVDASPCGAGKTEAYLNATIKRVPTLEDDAVILIAARTASNRDDAGRRLEDNAAKLGIDVNGFVWQCRQEDNCKNFNKYNWLNRASKGEGTKYCKLRCPFRDNCKYVENSEKLSKPFKEASIIILTHAMVDSALDKLEEEDRYAELIVWDEEPHEQRVSATIAQLKEFKQAQDIENIDKLIEQLEANKHAWSLAQKLNKRGPSIEVVLPYIQDVEITTGDDSAAGQIAVEEAYKDKSRCDVAPPDWRILDALEMTREQGGKGAYIEKGVLSLPVSYAPNIQRATTAVVLDASATKTTATALYGEHRWSRLNTEQNEHITHIHINAPGCSSNLRNDGQWSSERSRLIALAIRWLAGRGALHIGHKKWYDNNPPFELNINENRRTYFGSSEQRGSNRWEKLNTVVLWDWRLPAIMKTCARPSLLELLLEGETPDQAQLVLESWAQLEHANSEQGAGRIRPLNATKDNPKTIITIGQREAPPLEGVGNFIEIDGADLLAACFGIIGPDTLEGFAQALSDQINGLVVKRTNMNHFNNMQCIAESCFLNMARGSSKLNEHKNHTMIDDHCDHDVLEEIKQLRQEHKPTIESLERATQDGYFNAMPLIEVNQSQGPALRVLPPSKGLQWSRLKSIAESIDASWFGIGQWKYEKINDTWHTEQSAKQLQRTQIMETLQASELTPNASHKAIYGVLSGYFERGQRTTKQRISNLFDGGLKSLKDQWKSSHNENNENPIISTTCQGLPNVVFEQKSQSNIVQLEQKPVKSEKHKEINDMQCIAETFLYNKEGNIPQAIACRWNHWENINEPICMEPQWRRVTALLKGTDFQTPHEIYVAVGEILGFAIDEAKAFIDDFGGLSALQDEMYPEYVLDALDVFGTVDSSERMAMKSYERAQDCQDKLQTPMIRIVSAVEEEANQNNAATVPGLLRLPQSIDNEFMPVSGQYKELIDGLRGLDFDTPDELYGCAARLLYLDVDQAKRLIVDHGGLNSLQEAMYANELHDECREFECIQAYEAEEQRLWELLVDELHPFRLLPDRLLLMRIGALLEVDDPLTWIDVRGGLEILLNELDRRDLALVDACLVSGASHEEILHYLHAKNARDSLLAHGIDISSGAIDDLIDCGLTHDDVGVVQCDNWTRFERRRPISAGYIRWRKHTPLVDAEEVDIHTIHDYARSLTLIVPWVDVSGNVDVHGQERCSMFGSMNLRGASESKIYLEHVEHVAWLMDELYQIDFSECECTFGIAHVERQGKHKRLDPAFMRNPTTRYAQMKAYLSESVP